LPLKTLDVQTRIDGLVARTTVSQTFVNTLGVPLEATYIFPLPDRAAVTSFRLEVAGRIVEAVLKERGQAREEYEKALREGHRAAIAEEDRPGVFNLSVGNLPPGEKATVRLTLTGPLACDGGEATFRFPLVVAPRYIPGTPLPGPSVGDGTIPDTDAVPDASRISPPVLLPGYPNPVQLNLAVEVHLAGLPGREFRSSLHTVEEQRCLDGSLRFCLRPGKRIDRDFILRFRLDDEAIGTSLALQPSAGNGDEGTFLLTLVPPRSAEKIGPARDLVFVLDRSGSMEGWKMVAARRALARMIDTLTGQDRFTVLAFDHAVETPPGGEALIWATDRHRFQVLEWLARVGGRGGTEMAGPLDRAVKLLCEKGDRPLEAKGISPIFRSEVQRARILVLLTDGQVGNEDQLLGLLGQRLQGLRIFTLGIDRAVNEAFLRRLAGLGGGYTEVVESEDRLDEVLARIHRRIGTPVLTELKLEPAGLSLDPTTLVPARLPDLFAGVPLLVSGRYRGPVEGGLTLQARDEAGRPWSATVHGKPSTNPALTLLWARGQVRQLEDRYACRGGNLRALEREIVATSLAFGVLCRFTAFVAVDVKEVVNPGGQVERVVQPVELPGGWEANLVDSDHIAILMDPSTPVPSIQFRACQAQASPPPGGSLFRKIGGQMKKKLRSGTPTSTPLDLGPYRQRAQEMLNRIQAVPRQTPEERHRALGVLAVQLERLLEDLRSVGAAGEEVAELNRLLTELKNFGTQGTVSKETALWEKTLLVLETFSKAKGERKRSFWK
jgi:Ca-activated chloride channel family protein